MSQGGSVGPTNLVSPLLGGRKVLCLLRKLGTRPQSPRAGKRTQESGPLVPSCSGGSSTTGVGGFQSSCELVGSGSLGPAALPWGGLGNDSPISLCLQVGQGYPHDPPKVKCETMVYHPNIDLEGNVCLNILREDWKPVLTINSIIYGLQYLFLEPNPEDPLNKEAAEVLQNNRRLFEQNVQRSMRGGYIGSTYFERCLK
uniref:NEDD8-conjugating enzyme UBC12 n=1 Tax=Chelonoidis abingdonii TaxID=106734 RepID=A0A8C0IPQ8_CHEAB